ncbi:MAG: OmpA family protein [Deltaproteobacteria bacterium]|nr:OmpA family protein [Deltaproteobacteria bacterium]
MKKKPLMMLFAVMISFLLTGCYLQMAQTPTTFKPFDLNPPVKAGKYVQKVNTFLVILDASGSMADSYKGQAKVFLAKDMVSRMNQTIPTMRLTGGLRVFGRIARPLSLQDDPIFSLTGYKNDLIYGLTPYSRSDFKEALKAVKRAGGFTPLDGAIDAGADDLEYVAGYMAVIIFSDGKEVGNAPVLAAKKMKKRFGDRVCIYTVLIGDDPAGKKIMQKIARAGGCGFSVTAEDIASSMGMADFVKRVFLTKAEKKRWVFQGINFDTDKYNIKPQYYKILDQAVSVLKKNPSIKLEIQGHTDSRASKEYNQTLSENRAKSVMEYLVNKGISRGRLNTVGYGLSRPIAPNTTPEGMAKNRRAELKQIN